MHATIALCLMMVGGPLPPEPEIINVPLKDDLSAINSIQDKEWKARNKSVPLPRVPTLADPETKGNYDNSDNVKTPRGRYLAPTDPNAPQRRPALMPTAPTDPGAIGQDRRMGPMPVLPGAGMNQSDDAERGRNYGNLSRRVNGNMGGQQVQTAAPIAPSSPIASNYLSTIYNQNSLNAYGVSPNPITTGVSGGQKPFNDYQRPNGYSPWMSLYSTPTNGGTVSPYFSSVQPQLQQQQYNQQMAAQIQGVRNSIVSPQGGRMLSPEMPVNGAGMVNPNSFLNYSTAPPRQ